MKQNKNTHHCFLLSSSALAIFWRVFSKDASVAWTVMRFLMSLRCSTSPLRIVWIHSKLPCAPSLLGISSTRKLNTSPLGSRIHYNGKQQKILWRRPSTEKILWRRPSTEKILWRRPSTQRNLFVSIKSLDSLKNSNHFQMINNPDLNN